MKSRIQNSEVRSQKFRELIRIITARLAALECRISLVRQEENSILTAVLHKIGYLIILSALVLPLSGCATVLANQAIQRKHAAIQATAVNGGAGIGVSLFDITTITTWQDAGLQMLGAACDLGIAYASYRVYERINDTTTTPATPTVQTGNNSTVIVINGNPGNSSVAQGNDNK